MGNAWAFTIHCANNSGNKSLKMFRTRALKIYCIARLPIHHRYLEHRDISGRICFLLLNKNKPAKVKGWMESSGLHFTCKYLQQEKWSGFSGKLCQSNIFQVSEVFIPFLHNYPWCIYVSLLRIKDTVQELGEFGKHNK